MTTRNSRSSKGSAPSSKDLASDLVKLSPAYYKELEDTFQLYDAKGSGRLSIKNLRLAMRTLGFEASIDDIQEIIQEMPTLSIHKAMKTQTSRYHGGVSSSKSSDSRKGKGVKRIEVKGQGSSPALQGTRRSSRAAAVASRTSERSNYVDSDNNDNESSGTDDDTYEDEKGDKVPWESQNEQGDSEFSFTFEDFVTIMTPSEKQHGMDEMSRVFKLFDTQSRGFLRLEDLRRVATELNIPFNDEELREMIEETARDVDFGVTEQDFAKIMTKTGF